MSGRQPRFLLENVLGGSVLAWVSAAFSICYALFFIRPVFLSSDAMQFYRYLPAINPIGHDLRMMLSYCTSWFVYGQTPYIGLNMYPPLTTVLFTPLTLVSFTSAYAILSLSSLFCYALICFVLPRLTAERRRVSPLHVLILATGLLSYGLQFELERGQFNVIAVGLCFTGVWIYHYRNSHRWLAYLLFTISVQLKLYPFIFILMLIRDWRAWRDNIRRLSLLALANCALFLVLGPGIAADFLRQITALSAAAPTDVLNHSIRGFVSLAAEAGNQRGWTWPGQSSGPLAAAFLVIVAFCILAIVLRAYRTRTTGLNEHLLLACTIGALVLPLISWDYTLAVLAAPMGLLLQRLDESPREAGRSPRSQIVFVMTVVVLSAAYASTLFPPEFKPATLVLASAFPALIAMLLVVTWLYLSPLGMPRQPEVEN